MRLTWTWADCLVRLPGGRRLQDMEDQTAGHRAGLGKPHLDLVRQAKDEPCPASGQRLLPLIMLPVIVRQRAHRHETTRAAFRQL